MLEPNKIYQANAVDGTYELDSNSIDTIVTSPPYWGLRDYGVEDQIGLEPTLEKYHTRLLEVTAECKRILKKTGTMFWVHGDSYGGSGNASGHTEETTNCGKKTSSYGATKGHTVGFMPKCLLMQNYRLAMRMIDEQGWILRNILIWHKKNHMPSSLKDRYANAYEPVFFFTKSKKYYFDLEAIHVPRKECSLERVKHKWNCHREPLSSYENMDMSKMCHPSGKNPGDVFTLSTQPFPEAHFAVFPEKLIEPFINAGCPAEVCRHCGFIRKRISTKEVISPRVIEGIEDNTSRYSDGKPKTGTRFGDTIYNTRGWTSCTCEDQNKYEPGIVLDPFMGAGTTAAVAKKLSRSYYGIEINPEYIKIAQKRLSAIPQRLDSYKVL